MHSLSKILLDESEMPINGHLALVKQNLMPEQFKLLDFNYSISNYPTSHSKMSA